MKLIKSFDPPQIVRINENWVSDLYSNEVQIYIHGIVETEVNNSEVRRAIINYNSNLSLIPLQALEIAKWNNLKEFEI